MLCITKNSLEILSWERCGRKELCLISSYICLETEDKHQALPECDAFFEARVLSLNNMLMVIKLLDVHVVAV
jgi:hypothetical protein